MKGVGQAADHKVADAQPDEVQHKVEERRSACALGGRGLQLDGR